VKCLERQQGGGAALVTAVMAAAEAECVSSPEDTEVPEVGQPDDGATYDGCSLAGTSDAQGLVQMEPSEQNWMVPYWPEGENNWYGADHYGMLGGGALDWQAQAQAQAWQVPYGMDGSGWRSGGGRSNYAVRPKRRFCTSYPDVSQCRRGSSCAFAHSREDILAQLLAPEEENQDPAAMTDEFFMFKYKMRWCPIGVQHEWHTCVYAHNYQDARRPVDIGYGAKLCPYWSKKDTGAEYSQRCPLGIRCPYSHGAKEQLYHPHYFKTVVCRDLRGKACPRTRLCAFFHHRNERRQVLSEEVDYTQPLSTEVLPSSWVSDFLSPPFLSDNSRQDKGDYSGMYSGQQFGQMPCVFFMPVSPMMAPVPCSDPGMAESESPGSPSLSPSALPASWVFVPMDGSSQAAPMT